MGRGRQLTAWMFSQMSHYRLVYFDVPGRAEAIRICAHAAGIQLEDVRLERTEFAKMKANGEFLFGQVPVLYIDGQQYCQTNAILRYFGKLAGLYPEDPLQALKVDMLIDAGEDLSAKFLPLYQETDEEKKTLMRQEIANGYMKTWLERVNSILASSGATVETPRFLLGDNLSIADISLYRMALYFTEGRLNGIPTTIIDDNAPLISGLVNLVRNHEKVVAYYSR